MDVQQETRIRNSDFRPAWWLKNRHLQTIYPAVPWASVPRPGLRSEPLELPDGDLIVVDWLSDGPQDPGQSPLLVILHGLEGSADSSYARQLLHAASENGWNACVLHFRDCGDYRNRLPRRYHAGETNDIRYFLDKLRAEGQEGPMFAAGYSLGGNVLLKYLGENATNTPLHAAAAVSVPFNLHLCSEAVTRGFSKIYQNYLLKRMKKAVSRKFDRHTAAFDWQKTMSARTFAEFDDAVTAPLHGFSGKDEYYDRCSASGYLHAIERPTLIINSMDDPFMTPEVLPPEDCLSDYVTIEVSDWGGHVGYISGGTPWKPNFYLPTRITGFLESHVSDTAGETYAIPGL